MADEASDAPQVDGDAEDRTEKAISLQGEISEKEESADSFGTNGQTDRSEKGTEEIKQLDKECKSTNDNVADDSLDNSDLFYSTCETPNDSQASENAKVLNGQNGDQGTKISDDQEEVINNKSSPVEEGTIEQQDESSSGAKDETDAVPFEDHDHANVTPISSQDNEEPMETDTAQAATDESSQDMDVTDIIRNIDELSGGQEPMTNQSTPAQICEEPMEAESGDVSDVDASGQVLKGDLDEVDSTLPTGESGEEAKSTQDENVETSDTEAQKDPIDDADDSVCSKVKDKAASQGAQDDDTKTSDFESKTDENESKLEEGSEIDIAKTNENSSDGEKVDRVKPVSGPVLNTASITAEANSQNAEVKKDEPNGLDAEGEQDTKPEDIKTDSSKGNDKEGDLKDFATDTVNEFLGIMGMDKLDDKEKADVSSQLSSKAVIPEKSSGRRPQGKSFTEKNRAEHTQVPLNQESDNEIQPMLEEPQTSSDERESSVEKVTTTSEKSSTAETAEESTKSDDVKPIKGSPKAAAKSGSAEGKDGKDAKGGKPPQQCIVCKKVGKCKYNIVRNGDIKHLCDDSCFKVFRANPTTYLRGKDASSASTPSNSGSSKSGSSPPVTGTCSFCSIGIPTAASGKFSMTVGNDKHSFCGINCRDEFKKRLKLCAFCSKNISKDPSGFMAPVKGGAEFKDFCSQNCHQKYEAKPPSDDVQIVGTSKVPQVSRVTRAASGQATCAVCGKMAAVKHEVNYDGKVHKLCGDPCFAAFRYANKLSVNTCENCGVYCYNEGMNPQTIQFEGALKRFCSISCVNTFKNGRKKIIACAWCNTRKSNFDMIERVDANNKYQMFCSLNCLSLYRVNLQATSNQNVACDQCRKVAPAQYHLTMSDASVRNFCAYNCVMAFQAQFTAPKGSTPAKKSTTPATNNQGASQATPQTTTAVRQSPRQAAKVAQAKQQQQKSPANVPVISNVMSLASAGQTPSPAARAKPSPQVQNATPVGTRSARRQSSEPPTPMVPSGTQTVTQQVIVKPPPPKQVKNKLLLVKPFTQTKATSCKPHTQTKETQTDEAWNAKPALIPVPIPIYIPVPMAMYSAPAPYPLPLPVPVPIPCFIPTTRKSADSILKHIKEIQERMPADPFEAELLMMAEAVEKAEKGSDESSDESDNDEVAHKAEAGAGSTTPASQGQDDGEDMLQMALRIATEMPAEQQEQQLDLETSLTPLAVGADVDSRADFSTIDAENVILSATQDVNVTVSPRGRRGGKRRGGRGGGRPKRQRLEEPESEAAPAIVMPPVPQPAPDANMVLKFTYGVNAWKHWVMGKNLQLERASSGRSKLKMFKTDILQCTADELNYSLCLFVKEVRKPNSDEYAPDSIYYLCLGIQQYLFENGRIDNIFTDFYYEKFTECLNEVLQRYEVRLNEAGMIVCRIEEEHLWESKQLGAHSPHVLLNTLVYFNTKFFMLKTTEDHLNLSFSHIMKHWKKTNIPGAKAPGRSVYLRYYAPGVGADGSKKNKREETPVFEQGENVDNPLRCPVKLYEFYLSKCPESIKNRNDVFYLVPERSCVPDSPVWYSTASLGGEAMSKMLNRVRLVREIQEAALHTHPMYVT